MQRDLHRSESWAIDDRVKLNRSERDVVRQGRGSPGVCTADEKQQGRGSHQYS